jgi:septal ring factor EnvC (AmiA/AmiB activator)
MRKSNFALRLQPSLLDEARRTADEEGVALNQFINVAVAEKLSAIRTESFFRERARRANVPEAIEILNRMGKGNPPMEGDQPQGPAEANRIKKNSWRVKKVVVPGPHCT